jgi:hypothetical protein
MGDERGKLKLGEDFRRFCINFFMIYRFFDGVELLGDFSLIQASQ